MSGSLQIPRLAHDIAEYIRVEQIPVGTRLPGRKLAERFRVSRTPIERALQLLVQHAVVATAGAGGYVVGHSPPALSPEALGAPEWSDDERLYLRMADDHSAGHLPGRASENELIRRYHSNRAAVVRALQRAAAEGWTERLPGRGWVFVPLLAAGLTYEQVCRFRIVVEPAAILEPTFVLDRPVMEACHAEQVALFDRATGSLSPAAVFESGSRFHQAVVACSHNPFFINGLMQANKVRRLIEYRRTPASQHWRERCRDHAHIAELLLADERQRASDATRRHLEQGAREKA